MPIKKLTIKTKENPIIGKIPIKSRPIKKTATRNMDNILNFILLLTTNFSLNLYHKKSRKFVKKVIEENIIFSKVCKPFGREAQKNTKSLTTSF